MCVLGKMLHCPRRYKKALRAIRLGRRLKLMADDEVLVWIAPGDLVSLSDEGKIRLDLKPDDEV